MVGEGCQGSRTNRTNNRCISMTTLLITFLLTGLGLVLLSIPLILE